MLFKLFDRFLPKYLQCIYLQKTYVYINKLINSGHFVCPILYRFPFPSFPLILFRYFILFHFISFLEKQIRIPY